MTGTRRRDGLFDNPGVAIAAGVGVLIIVIGALVVFFGGFPAQPGLTQPGIPETTQSPGQNMQVHAVAYAGTPGVLSYNVAMTSGYELSELTVPDKGVFIRVIYRGGYTGTWTSGNETGDVQNSGERLVAVENPGSSLSADLVKLDNSARQPLTVEIWKNGARLASNSTSLPFGEVTVSGNL
jgi:hypothetical protein